MRYSVSILAAAFVLLCPFESEAQSADAGADREARVEPVTGPVGNERRVRFPIGRSAGGTLIWCVAQPEALDLRSPRQRQLIVGGLDGSDDSVKAALATFDRFSMAANSQVAYACVLIVNPDRRTANAAPQATGARGDADALPTFPPEGNAYNDPDTVLAHVVWRFVGWFAPDVVIEIHAGNAAEWQQVRQGTTPADKAWPDDSLGAAVRREPVAGIATTLSLRSPGSMGGNGAKDAPEEADRLQAYRRAGHPAIGPEDRSPLRQAVQQRLERTPVEVAQQLSQHYGDHLQTVMYQPALALVARLRLGELTGDGSHQSHVEKIVAPYVDGSKPTLAGNVNGSLLSGHLIFAELARLSDDPHYVTLVRRAADFGFDDTGAPLEAMPFHSEMSDAVFMSCPVLTAAARSTAEERHLKMAGRHLAFMQRLCLREDGLYRHSPLCEAAWGRGNGFPALGLALSLADLEAMPASPARDELRGAMLQSLRQHLRALAEHQDVTGMWRQVIDDPGSYRELTATCMITYAMVRGIRSGWLDESEFAPAARRAWDAIKVRIGEDGVLMDVCTGTGRQNTLQDYWNRTSILSRDERGGAMALMAAVEMAEWESDAVANPGAGGTVPPAAGFPDTPVETDN
jgi:unsaturated rhamnogalacturonyl hydrolase